MEEKNPDGSNSLERDSKMGLWVAGIGTVVLDAVVGGVLETLTSLDTSSWSGWWVTLASAAVSTAVGMLTAYKARRRKAAFKPFGPA